MTREIFIIYAEGRLDVAAAARIAEEHRFKVAGVKKSAEGIEQFWKNIGKYNRAASSQEHVVFALADHDDDSCVGEKLRSKLPIKSPNLVLRLCVRELESWLLADTKGLSRFFGLSPSKFPARPDALPNPKLELVNLARRSPVRNVSQGVPPRAGESGTVGREYTLVIEEFIAQHWSSKRASENSPSLNRAISALSRALREQPPPTTRNTRS